MYVCIAFAVKNRFGHRKTGLVAGFAGDHTVNMKTPTFLQIIIPYKPSNQAGKLEKVSAEY